MEFIEYELKSDMLCMGERIKKGQFRPTVTTIPYTQITGALKAIFGDKEIHAVGHLENYEKNYLTYSPRDRTLNTSKLPLYIEFLTNVQGRVYILIEDFPDEDEIEITMGALKSKGFGRCVLRRIGNIDELGIMRGTLNTRIPEELKDIFVIKKIIKPRYGYLFKPTSETSGVYVLSLFEGSEVVGPRFLLEK